MSCNRNPLGFTGGLASLALLVCVVSGCNDKKPMPMGQSAPPAVHDFEADRNKVPSKVTPDNEVKPTSYRHLPQIHDFEADRKKANK